MISYEKDNRVEFLVKVASISGDLGRDGILMKDKQNENLLKIINEANKYYENIKNRNSIKILYEIRELEDAKILKLTGRKLNKPMMIMGVNKIFNPDNKISNTPELKTTIQRLNDNNPKITEKIFGKSC